MNRIKRLGMKSLLPVLAILLFFILPAAADEAEEQPALEEIVVTATRTEVPLEGTTKSVDVVHAEDVEDLEEYYLPELIDNQPGVLMRRLGGLGQWSNISIRGAGAQHTQFQYNGMPLRDAADTQSTLQYFIEDMFSTTNLDRIEILKGTNSTLYGSQAMGGVINVIPKKWQKGLSAELRGEFGPNDTYIANGRLAYGKDNFYIDVNPLYLTTDGEKYGGEYGYYYENTGLTFGAGVKPTDSTALEFTALIYDTDLALSSVTPALDADGNLIKNQASKDKHRESLIYQLGMNFSHETSKYWDYTVKGSYGETERHYFWSAISGDQSNYDGKTMYMETQHNLHVTNWLTFNVGADYEKQIYDGREPRDTNVGDYTRVDFDEEWGSYDLFTQAQLSFLDKSLLFNLGGRYHNHEKFDDKGLWEVSGAYILKPTNTKFHAQVGTGYRTPSLYEIYGGYLYNGTLITIGNPDLMPEESIGCELGIDQSFLDGKVKVGATYFFTQFEDLIIYDGAANRYDNASKAEISGVEAYLTLRPWKMLRLDFAYTYADSKYKANKDATEWTRKEYLPKSKLDFVATLYPTEKLTIACDVSWQDEKIVPLYDANYASVRWEEDAVTTVNMAVTYELLSFMKLFVRAENLLDEDYTESAYCMPGRTIYGGVKLFF